MKIGVYKVAMASPSDVSELTRLIDANEIDPAEIVALIGKTEGNGGANDFTRGFATLSYQLMLSRRLGLSAKEVGERIAFVWSGGTEGVLSPHATVFTRSSGSGEANGSRLALGIDATRDILPEEVGTMIQVREVADAVRRCLKQAGINDPKDVHYVQVKGPLLTPATIADADARGKKLVTRDPNGSKPYARGATALGVALGLSEAKEEDLSDEVIARRLDIFSSVASTSAGGELKNCEVLLFGNSPTAMSEYRIGHAVLRDVIDAEGIRAALLDAGLSGSISPAGSKRIAAVFAKADASPNGLVRGRRTTMLSDADINYERHARAALGAVIASITNDPAIFVSGGTEHQCAPGEAPIATVVHV
jgi:cyanuric acid amidohydrolase